MSVQTGSARYVKKGFWFWARYEWEYRWGESNQKMGRPPLSWNRESGFNRAPTFGEALAFQANPAKAIHDARDRRHVFERSGFRNGAETIDVDVCAMCGEPKAHASHIEGVESGSS